MAGNRPVVVAGAGIAGLTLALALARRGVAVRVYERAAALEEVGAGLQLAPNASRALDALGLGPALDRAAIEPVRLAILSGRSGAEIEEDMGVVLRRQRTDAHELARADADDGHPGGVVEMRRGGVLSHRVPRSVSRRALHLPASRRQGEA
jgi:2-polyprenyl-6-methoxyphenol hydroxylase-like FAD-dependent oxidoreductase